MSTTAPTAKSISQKISASTSSKDMLKKLIMAAIYAFGIYFFFTHADTIFEAIGVIVAMAVASTLTSSLLGKESDKYLNILTTRSFTDPDKSFVTMIEYWKPNKFNKVTFVYPMDQVDFDSFIVTPVFNNYYDKQMPFGKQTLKGESVSDAPGSREITIYSKTYQVTKSSAKDYLNKIQIQFFIAGDADPSRIAKFRNITKLGKIRKYKFAGGGSFEIIPYYV